MGILIDDARLLLAVRTLGVKFGRTLTLGRQNFYVDARDRERLVRAVGIPVDDPRAVTMGTDAYVDSFLRLLGAEHVDAMDASDYEGATLIHDLNEPLPLEWRASYDVVLEAGTLEHVFDVRRSFATAMELVREGGHFIAIAPANNQCGHGFYQFSPELFYRVLSDDNGFRVLRLLIHEDYAGGPWYDVVDPAAVRSRVELIGPLPAMLAVIAQRTRLVPILQQPPQQSDYVVLWRAPRQSAADVPPFEHPSSPWLRAQLRDFLTSVAPAATRAVRRWWYARSFSSRSLTNRRWYRPAAWTDWPRD